MSTKKENKNAYKLVKFRAGIFQIKNTNNGKIYLQASTDLDRGYNSDRFQLNAGLHPNKELQKDWNASGANAFEYSLVDELKTAENVTNSEIKKDLLEFLELHRCEFLKNGNILY
ncbi:MAG: GIY-YIG nuclease family protein [Bacteroidota bacterium]